MRWSVHWLNQCHEKILSALPLEIVWVVLKFDLNSSERFCSSKTPLCKVLQDSFPTNGVTSAVSLQNTIRQFFFFQMNWNSDSSIACSIELSPYNLLCSIEYPLIHTCLSFSFCVHFDPRIQKQPINFQKVSSEIMTSRLTWNLARSYSIASCKSQLSILDLFCHDMTIYDMTWQVTTWHDVTWHDRKCQASKAGRDSRQCRTMKCHQKPGF